MTGAAVAQMTVPPRPRPTTVTPIIAGDRDLLVELGKLRKAPHGKRIVHLLSSSLAGRTTFAKELDVANRVIAAVLVTGASYRIFNLSNGDVVFCYAQVATPVVVALCTSLETSFFGGMASHKNLYGEFGHYKMFDPTRDLPRLIDGVRLALASEPVLGAWKPPIAAKHAEYVCEKLRGSNIRSIVFNQPIYYIGHTTPSIEFLEFYTSIERLEALFVPDWSITGSPWLFNLIKRELDVSLMRAINEEIAGYRHKAFSLNLLVDSFMSDGFREFVGSLPAKMSGRIFVELDKTDLVQHSHCLAELYQRSKQLGVPICLDGLSHYDIQTLRLSHLSCRFIKLKWDPEIAQASAELIALLVKEIATLEAKVVLTRCDSPKALAFARAMGIEHIQGRLADEMFRGPNPLD